MSVRRAAATLLFLLGGVAWPCSLAGETPRARFVSPATGSAAVPLNGEVKVLLEYAWTDDERFALRDAVTGEAVPVTVSRVRDEVPNGAAVSRADFALYRLRPDAPLAPRRKYEALWGTTVLTAFETGTRPDTGPPAAPGRASASFVAEESSCFGDTRRYDLRFDDAEDDATPAGQLVYLATLDGVAAPRVAALTAEDRFLGQTLGNGNLALDAPEALSGTLVAVDWAGNVSAPRRLSLSPGLAGTRVAQGWRMLPQDARLVVGGLCSFCSFSFGLVFLLTLRLRRRRAEGAP